MADDLVLTMDGSTSVCSAALLSGRTGCQGGDWKTLSSRVDDDGRGQARTLLRMVDDMLKETGASPEDLDSIVVGTGPGTFTGVRIAVATARGLAVGLGLPVLGVDSLSALTVGALAEATQQERAAWNTVVAVIDARRGQIFFSAHQRTGSDTGEGRPEWVRALPIEACDRDSLLSRLESLESLEPERTVVVGQHDGLVQGLPVMMRFIASEIGAEYLLACREAIAEGDPLGDGMAAGGGDGRLAGRGAPESVKPIYVRAPDADIHITKMKDPWSDGR